MLFLGYTQLHQEGYFCCPLLCVRERVCCVLCVVCVCVCGVCVECVCCVCGSVCKRRLTGW